MNVPFNFKKILPEYYNSAQIDRLQRVKIGIAGAGGLGSNCAVLLVRSGIHQVVIADFDRVNASNLNRQAYSITHIGRFKVECLKEICLSINPEAYIITSPNRIDPSTIHQLFDECDIIIEAFDCPVSKALLFSEYLHSGKLLVGASGIAGIGNCDSISVRKIREHCYIVGDERSAVTKVTPAFAPRVTVAAAKMADIVLQWIVGESE